MADETQQTTRDVLSAAYDAQVSAAETSTTAAPTEAVKTETAAPAAVETTSTAEQRARDDKGRFAPKTDTAEPSKPGEESATAPKAGAAPEPGKAKADGTAPPPPPVPSAEAAAPKVKPPQSWKPAIRELAAKLPAEYHPILEEVDRRERETTKVLQETAQVRQFAGQVQQSLSPYQSIAAANGTDVMTWAGTALQTVAALYAGTPQQKAQVIAQAIALSGVDVDAINAAMQGQPAPQQAAPQQNTEAVVQRVIQQRLQQVEAQRAEQQASEFIQGAPEFLNDVKDDMVEILRLAEARGGKMTYQQAYEKACKVNEDVQKVLEQRKAGEAAKGQVAAAQKAQAAASSVKSSPVTSSPAQPKGRRAALEAAWDKQSAG